MKSKMIPRKTNNYSHLPANGITAAPAWISQRLNPCYCRINLLLYPLLLWLLERFIMYNEHTQKSLKTLLSSLKPDLQPRVSKELIEEVHEEVDLEAADTQHHMFLSLRPVAAVVASGFLTLHPQKGQLLKLHSGWHLSHSTDGKWIKLAGVQQRPRCYMKRKTMHIM